MRCYLRTHSHFTSSESRVNISLSNLFSLLQTGTLTPSSLGFPHGDAFIDYSYFGHCPSVWAWCFLLIPFRFCIFGWNSAEGGWVLRLVFCQMVDGFHLSRYQCCSLITDFGSFCQASPLKSVVMSRLGSCFETKYLFLSDFLFIQSCQWRLTASHFM